MPVLFYVDPKILRRSGRQGRPRNHALTYTFFPVEKPDDRRLNGRAQAKHHEGPEIWPARKNHDYHILPTRDLRRLVGAIVGARPGDLAPSAGCTRNAPHMAALVFILGLLGVLVTMFMLVVGRDQAKRMPAITRRSCRCTCATA